MAHHKATTAQKIIRDLIRDIDKGKVVIYGRPPEEITLALWTAIELIDGAKNPEEKALPETNELEM